MVYRQEINILLCELLPCLTNQSWGLNSVVKCMKLNLNNSWFSDTDSYIRGFIWAISAALLWQLWAPCWRTLNVLQQKFWLHLHSCCVVAVQRDRDGWEAVFYQTVLLFVEEGFSTDLLWSKREQKSHLLKRLTYFIFPPPASVSPSCFDPPSSPFHPPFLLPLPSYLLPPLAVAFCQSAHPPVGEGCLNSPSLPSHSLSLSVSFQRFPLCPSPLSHRNSLHSFTSSPSSKMTFSDYTRALQFSSVKQAKANTKSSHVMYGSWMTEGVSVRCNPSPAISIMWMLTCFGHTGIKRGVMSSHPPTSFLLYTSHPSTDDFLLFFFSPAH